MYSVFWWSWPSSKKESAPADPNEEDQWQKAKEEKIKILANKIKEEGAQARERQTSKRKSSPEWLQAQARLISAKIQTNKIQDSQILDAICKLIGISDNEIETEATAKSSAAVVREGTKLRYKLRL